MRSVFGKPGFRGTAASMPIRNVAHSGKLLWAGIHAGLVVVAMGLLLGGCPQPEGRGGTTVYTVTFNANGGTPAPAVQTAAGGGKVTEPAAMTKAGHTFGGWYKEAGLTSPWNFSTDTVTENITLYARWIPAYTVTFEANGGTPAPALQTVASGGTVTMPAAMTRDGHTFGGWFREAEFTNPWDFATDTVTANITLYVKWVADTHWAVAWNLNGGEWPGGAPPAGAVEKGQAIPEPSAPVKTGLSFDGWYTEAGLTNQWNFATAVTGNITLYAKWTATVTFEANGGAPVPAARIVANGEKITEPVAMTKANHIFGGWYKEAALDSQWDFATDTVTANITLYAKWTPAYTVTFEANGGAPVPAVQTVAGGDKIPEPAAPTKANYAFGGWYKEAGLTNQWDFATDTVTANITLYAKWGFAVTFNANGGAPVPADQIVVSGGKVTAPATMTKEGYIFGGWYKEAALTSQWDFATNTVTANITLYARWLSTYTVTFEANGGAPVPAAQPVTEGGKVTAPAAMTKEGYIFGGWYKEAALASRWDFATDTVTAAITLYARWRLAVSTYTGDNISFKTAYVPGGLSFPTGTSDNGTATVSAGYEIGETEVSYELWYTVRIWAEGNGYTFYNNPGREGSSGSSQNTTPGANRQEPVTMVTWFDAVVWLNALTEWVNAKTGSSLTPVYYYQSAYTTVAKNSNPSSNFVKESSSYSYASAYAKPGTTGFRLPTRTEWELAARWRNDGTNTVSGYSDPWFTQGDSASGATADYNNASATGAVAWYSGNASSKTHLVGQKAANGLGLYDMSGNVYEWCFDWYSTGSRRILWGGSWGSTAVDLPVGKVYYYNPDNRYSNFGFRPARTDQ